VSIREARNLLGGIGHTTLYALAKRGEIVKVNIGRRGLSAGAERDDTASRAESERVRQDSPPNVEPRRRAEIRML
jgi:hypothetical protein